MLPMIEGSSLFHSTMRSLASFQKGNSLEAKDGQLVVTHTAAPIPIPEEKVDNVVTTALKIIQGRGDCAILPDDINGLTILRRLIRVSLPDPLAAKDLNKEITKIFTTNFILLKLPFDILIYFALLDPTYEVFHLLRQLSSDFAKKLPLSTLRLSSMAQAAAKGHVHCLYRFCGLLRMAVTKADAAPLFETFFKNATPKAQGCLIRALKRQGSISPFIPYLKTSTIGHLRFFCRTAEQCSELLQLMPLCKKATSLDIRFLIWNVPYPADIEDGSYFERLQLQIFTNLRALSFYFYVQRKSLNDLWPPNIVQFFKSQPLTQLTQLVKLKLKIDNAQDNMPAPEQLASLSNLQELELEGFKDNFIPSILALKNLKVLRYPSFTFSERLFELTQLETLKIYHDLQGPDFCEKIDKFRSLKHLQTSLLIDHRVALYLKNCQPLQTLQLSSFSGDIQETEQEMLAALRQQTQLCTIQLASSYTAQFYKAIFLHASLRKATVTYYHDESLGALLAALNETAHACFIEDLTIIHPQALHPIMECVSRMTHLRSLQLGTFLPGNGLEHLSKLTRLERLKISCATAFSNHDLAKLQPLENLRSLILYDNAISITPRAAQTFLLTHRRLEYFYCPSAYFRNKPSILQSMWVGPNDLKKDEKYLMTHRKREGAQQTFHNI